MLIFNPAQTEHDDHLETGGAFFTITIRHGLFLEQLKRAATARTLQSPVALSRARLLLREVSNWHADSNVAVDCWVAELIALLDGAGSLKAPPSWVCRAKELLEDCFTEPLSLAAIGALLEVHPLYLIRVFRTCFGTTPGEYLRARRLREAATLLTLTSLPVAQLALDAGFADQAHLTHRFSAAFGISPAAYRRSTQA